VEDPKPNPEPEPAASPVPVAVKRYLTATEILTATDIVTVEVDVPEWGGIVRLRSLSSDEATAFVEAHKTKAQTLVGNKLVARCAVDENDKPLFTEAQVDMLKTKSVKAILRLQTVALEINGMGKDAEAKAKNA
jgi:hypothetical protein